MGSLSSGFPLQFSQNHDIQLSTALSFLVHPPAVQREKHVSKVGEKFCIQLDVSDILEGESPLFGLHLTTVDGGCVLGLSLSHCLAGKICKRRANKESFLLHHRELFVGLVKSRHDDMDKVPTKVHSWDLHACMRVIMCI